MWRHLLAATVAAFLKHFLTVCSRHVTRYADTDGTEYFAHFVVVIAQLTPLDKPAA